MEVSALCIQIFMNVFVLLPTQPGLSSTVQEPAFPIISPDRLQFFDYESVNISCGGHKESNAWRVMRKLHNMSTENVSDGCSTPAPSCTILHAFEKHSGEYWCETDKGERSQALNISVTDGPVILNLPAQPVKEGSHVTLQCIEKNTQKAFISDLYKDGVQLGTYYETNMTLSNVSKSDEGLYKCSISYAGESPESWLTVVKPIEKKGSDEEMPPMTNMSLVLIVLSTILTLLFLVIGLILYKKHKALKNETVSGPKEAIYFIVKPRKRNNGDTTNNVSDVTYAAVKIRKKGSKVSTATTQQYSSAQEPVYSLITLQT